jgi:hypothetical protein
VRWRDDGKTGIVMVAQQESGIHARTIDRHGVQARTMRLSSCCPIK